MQMIIQTFVALLLLNGVALASPQAYEMDAKASKIHFNYTFNDETVLGKFPHFSASVLLDFETTQNSRITLTIDARAARGGFVFATTSLRGPRVLATKQFPTIEFSSKSLRFTETGAELEGLITVRQVTRPITLQVTFLEISGKTPATSDKMTLRITGTLNRHDFGASGYPKMVGDTLSLDIRALINRKP